MSDNTKTAKQLELRVPDACRHIGDYRVDHDTPTTAPRHSDHQPTGASP